MCVGVEIQCDKCDAFFDNLSGPNVEFKIREDETKLVTTPIGTYGAKFGCTNGNEVCFIACITVTVC